MTATEAPTLCTVSLTVVMAVLPDLVQMVPIVALALVSQSGFATVLAYAQALPGFEPVFSPTVGLVVHHPHCLMHSAVVVAAVTLLLWGFLRSF